jgi:hypothetical protein
MYSWFAGVFPFFNLIKPKKMMSQDNSGSLPTSKSGWGVAQWTWSEIGSNTSFSRLRGFPEFMQRARGLSSSAVLLS